MKEYVITDQIGRNMYYSSSKWSWVYWHSYLIASLASKSFFADARSVIFVTNLVDSSSGVTVAPVTVRVVEVAVPALVTLPPGVVGLADTLTRNLIRN